MTHKTFTLKAINCQAYFYFEIKAHYVAAQTWKSKRSYETEVYVLWCLLLLLGSALFEFLRPEDQRRALQGCTETNKVCQIFNEVGGAVRLESTMELENPLNLKQKRLLDITCLIYCFFQ